MANETEVGNFVTLGNAVASIIGPSFSEKAIGLNLCHIETFPNNTNTIKVPKGGALVAEDLAESTAYTYSGNSELTDTATDLVAVKAVVATKLTVEAQRFGQPGAQIARIAREQGAALARKFDAAWLAEFASVTGSVTADAGLTKDDILDAQYTVYSNMTGAAAGGRLVFVGDYKGVNELRKELTSISASAFANQTMISLIMGAPQANGLVGELAGVDVYQTSGLPTSSSDDVACVFDPRYAFAAGLGGEFHVALEWLGAGGGFSHELSAYMFYDVELWNTEAACKVLSDS